MRRFAIYRSLMTRATEHLKVNQVSPYRYISYSECRVRIHGRTLCKLNFRQRTYNDTPPQGVHTKTMLSFWATVSIKILRWDFTVDTCTETTEGKLCRKDKGVSTTTPLRLLHWRSAARAGVCSRMIPICNSLSIYIYIYLCRTWEPLAS